MPDGAVRQPFERAVLELPARPAETRLDTGPLLRPLGLVLGLLALAAAAGTVLAGRSRPNQADKAVADR